MVDSFEIAIDAIRRPSSADDQRTTCSCRARIREPLPWAAATRFRNLVVALAVTLAGATNAAEPSGVPVEAEVLALDLTQVSRTVRSRGRLELRLLGRAYVLELEPNDLMSPRYRSVAMTERGPVELPRPEVTTYKGRVAGDEGSDVRLLIQPDFMFGYVQPMKVPSSSSHESASNPARVPASFSSIECRSGSSRQPIAAGRSRAAGMFLKP